MKLLFFRRHILFLAWGDSVPLEWLISWHMPTAGKYDCIKQMTSKNRVWKYLQKKNIWDILCFSLSISANNSSAKLAESVSVGQWTHLHPNWIWNHNIGKCFVLSSSCCFLSSSLPTAYLSDKPALGRVIFLKCREVQSVAANLKWKQLKRRFEKIWHPLNDNY